MDTIRSIVYGGTVLNADPAHEGLATASSIFNPFTDTWSGVTWGNVMFSAALCAVDISDGTQGPSGRYSLRGVIVSDFAVGNAGFVLPTLGLGAHYNGSAWERTRGNTEDTVMTAGNYSGTHTSATYTNFNARGAHFLVKVNTVAGGGQTVTPQINAHDSVTNTDYPVLVGLPISTTGVTILKIYPGITGSPNASANDILPRQFNFTMTHSGAGVFNYSVTQLLVV